MIPGDWRTVSIVALLAFIAVTAYCIRPKKRGASRLRKLRREPLPDPWSGAIVQHRKFFHSNWTAAVGRAYRSN